MPALALRSGDFAPKHLDTANEVRGILLGFAHRQSRDAALPNEGLDFGCIKQHDPAIDFVAADQTGVGPTKKRFPTDAKAFGERFRFTKFSIKIYRGFVR